MPLNMQVQGEAEFREVTEGAHSSPSSVAFSETAQHFRPSKTLNNSLDICLHFPAQHAANQSLTKRPLKFRRNPETI